MQTKNNKPDGQYVFFWILGELSVKVAVAFNVQVQEANAALAEQEDVAPVQRRIEPRSADDSLSGVVRCLCFADTFLRDGASP